MFFQLSLDAFLTSRATRGLISINENSIFKGNLLKSTIKAIKNEESFMKPSRKTKNQWQHQPHDI
jgi:hypothetical protein